MTGWFRRIYNMIVGPYEVVEDLQYGLFAKRAPRGRFHSLKRAKSFARRLVPHLEGAKIVVRDAVSLKNLIIYKPKQYDRYAGPPLGKAPGRA